MPLPLPFVPLFVLPGLVFTLLGFVLIITLVGFVANGIRFVPPLVEGLFVPGRSDSGTEGGRGAGFGRTAPPPGLGHGIVRLILGKGILMFMPPLPCLFALSCASLFRFIIASTSAFSAALRSS